MNVFFIKATYQNNVYQLSDFFTGTQYKQDALKKLDLVIKCDDGITSIIVPNKLPDLSDVKDYTHVIIPEQEKIYKIIATDYYNTSQYEVTLDDDPFIANYQELKTKNLIINRTNDFTYFRGIHDISDMTTKRTTLPFYSPNANPISKIGPFALLFFQSDVAGKTIELKFNTGSGENLERFASFADIVTAYPETITSTPQIFDYYMKQVKLSTDGTTFYQCQYITNRLRWVKFDYYTETVSFTASNLVNFKANASDLNMVCIALPFAVNVSKTTLFPNYEVSKSFLHLESFNQTEFLFDIKIVDESAIDFSVFDQPYDSVTKEAKTIISSFPLSFNSDGFFYLISSKTITNVSRPEVTNVLSFPPFSKHYLSIYGQRFEISPRYFDKLYLMQSISVGAIDYILFYETKDNIIASGSFTNQTKWSIDQLNRFYEQNPTYKDQFYLKMMTDIGMKTVGGAIGGSVIPGVGTLVGGAIGLGAGLLDAGLSQINLNYQEKGLSLQPDQIMGNNASLPLQLINKFGIFWLEEKVVAGGGLEEMKTEYALRGFPTSIVAKIDDLTLRPNDIFTTVKLVHGELKETVKNHYVSGAINTKLKEGVIII